MRALATMGEGNTPLVESTRLGPDLDLHLLFKMEMCNPTGSYKDRFVAAEVTELLRRGFGACVATSSGNTGAALASFGARYGMTCAIFVNQFAPSGKLHQMQAHGAQVFQVKDFIRSPEVTERVFQRLQQMSEENSIPVVVSAYRYCPQGMKGVESIAAELLEQCRKRLDHVFVPVGSGGLFSAVCRGFSRVGGRRPKIHAVQPEGCATVVSAFEEGRDSILPVTSTTNVSGLAVPFDIDASIALAALRESGGRGIAVSDADVFTAQKSMMREEGIWCEPAGAAALAGCVRARKDGWIVPGEAVVCLVTGHGFKDQLSLAGVARENPVVLIEETDISAQLLEVKE
ncbi:MAG TPA: pyridoxal-phosphate dependent enzyme [Candidatus Limnocylindria bacterium]|nr:pyridoxal-phosphate dependent enzyme [Candidatus Limnocylindria bacterium]